MKKFKSIFLCLILFSTALQFAAAQNKNAAAVLLGDEATGENLCKELEKMLEEKTRNEYALNIKKIVGEERPASKIAKILYNEIQNGDK